MVLVDLHEDFAYSAQEGKDIIHGKEQSSIEMLKTVDKNAIIFSSIFPHIDVLSERSKELSLRYGFYTSSSNFSFDVLLSQLKDYYYLERTGHIKIIRSKEDLKKPGIKFLLSLEGTDSLKEFEDLYILKELHFLNVGLTWNYDTKFASSCFSRRDYGLTSEGEELVKLANKLGMIIDLAHASKRTVLDVCSITSKPVIISHGNARKLKDHVRNYDDEEIECVVKRGGVIGITAITSTLPEKSIKGLIENIKYIGESFGWDYVAIGTDFLGISEVPQGFEKITKIKELVIEGHEDQILWRNAYRVIEENL
ncbi:membrane dipeptidase [Acidianus sp. HS-5]|uniref:dipeptidase n=1 Tax=Acidianus sp. HS-5 TaxID=2886040 RepID=UPI001F00DD55|nr:membrane dipeptidase [Acidianus sp. HS-5]